MNAMNAANRTVLMLYSLLASEMKWEGGLSVGDKSPFHSSAPRQGRFIPALQAGVFVFGQCGAIRQAADVKAKKVIGTQQDFPHFFVRHRLDAFVPL